MLHAGIIDAPAEELHSVLQDCTKTLVGNLQPLAVIATGLNDTLIVCYA